MDYLALAMAGILYGGVVFGGKLLANMGATLSDVMLYPNLISMLVVLYPARRDAAKIFGQPRSVTLLFLGAMFFINVGQYAPLFLKVPVSLVVILLYLQPLWTILIERFYFGKKQTMRTWGLAVALLAGMFILINPFQASAFSPLGILLSLLGGLGLSVWVIVTQRFSEQGVSGYGTFFAASLYSVLPVALLVGGLTHFFPGNETYRLTLVGDAGYWTAFLFYSLAFFVLPNILVFRHNKNVPAAVTGMILMLEPVSGVILDVLFLHTALTWNILLGGGMILIANTVLILTSRGVPEEKPRTTK
jgi:drug/metabolite transporter (DMT)-like permease